MDWLDEIKARLAAATPGPWRLGEIHWHRGCGGRDCKQSVYGPTRTAGTLAVTTRAQYQGLWPERKQERINDPNAVLIANATTDLARLIAEVERLEVSLADSRKCVSDIEQARVLEKKRADDAERERNEIREPDQTKTPG